MSLLRTRPYLVLLPLLVVAGVLVWLLLREEDPYDPVRELAAVKSVDDRLGGRGVTVSLRPGTTAGDVVEVLDALPERSRAEVRIGEARLQVSREGRGARQAAPALAEAGKLRARIEIDTRSGGGELEAWVRQTDHAVPLARAIVAAGIGPETGVRTVQVKVERLELKYGETPIALDLTRAEDLVPAGLEAADRLAARGVTISTLGGRLEVRVRAEDSTGAGEAFRAASTALGSLEAGQRGDVAVYVDVPDKSGGPWSTLPVLGGSPGSSPDRATRLLRRLEAGGAESFVETDLEYVRARLGSRRWTLAAAEAARAAGAERIEVEWELPIARDWLAAVAGARRNEGRVEDTAAAAVRVLRGVERARAVGIDGVQWTNELDRGNGPTLAVTRPGWITGSGPLAEEDPDALRRLFRAVRRIDWPGAARIRLSLGRDACGEGTDRYVSMVFDATSSGRAFDVDGGSSCDVEDQMATIAKAWDATAR